MNSKYHLFTVTDFLCLIDRDCEGCRSVTNDIARIITEDLASMLSMLERPSRLVYRDSQGHWDEVKLKYVDRVAHFDGFAPIDIKQASSFDIVTPAFFGDPSDEELLALGYERPFKLLVDGRVAALYPINTWSIAIAVDIHAYGHADAYYYRSREAAKEALDNWDGAGEPRFWIRHPQSGRRRDDGDPAREHMQP